jgi:hypothetical protein
MLSEHAVVYANEKINETIRKGCLGTIVYVYNTDTYEVEFVDDNKCTIGLYTVTKDQIEGVSNEVE